MNNTAPADSFYKLIFFRFLIATIILVVNTAVFGLARESVYFIIAVTYLLTILYLLLLLARVRAIGVLYGQILLDLLLETALIHYTGGVDSVLSVLYPLSSITASILISPVFGVGIALLGSALFATTVIAEYFRILPLPAATAFLANEGDYVFSLLYFKVAIICAIGFLSAYIAEQVRKRDRLVVSLKEKLCREDRLSSIGKLVASTAHELRNPLASISGCVEVLKEKLELQEDEKKLFGLVLKETDRLNHIINGLLEYVKPRRLNLEKCDLGELIDDVVILLKNSRESRPGVEILRENREPELRVHCDSQQIKQVLFNIIRNALEAVGEQGEVVIRQGAGEDKNEAVIEVIDNGAGMKSEQLQTLFEPFSSSGKERGVGLGLAIASSIIKEHGGEISVSSRPGKGSSFRITMPVNPNNDRGEE